LHLRSGAETLSAPQSLEEASVPQYLSPGVYVEERDAPTRPIEGVGTAIAAFIGLAAQGPFNTPTLVTNWSQFTSTFGAFLEDSYLAHSVYGYFANGGGIAYVVRVGADNTNPAASVELPSASDAAVVGYAVTAQELGAAGNEISIEVADATEGAPAETFRIVVKRGPVQEPFDNLTVKPGAQNAVTVVNAGSQLVQLEEPGRTAAAKRRPAVGTYSLTGGAAAAPARIDTDDYVGDADRRTGLGGFQAVDEITMICIPDLMAAYQKELVDLEGVKAVQQGLVDHCTLMHDRMAILDPPPNQNAQEIKEWRVEKAGYDSAFAALYWPWIEIFDPLTSQNILVPPSGHMAGIWSRNDDTRGVHKAPANEVVRGALGVETQITRGEHDLLNPEGINVIRSFPGRGIRVWGARTLASDQTWRYVNIRRLFNYVEESILENTEWVVFEPNDQDLWQRIRRTITAFLLRLWRDGALFGLTPEQAFYVKCDEETNPPETVEAGQVVVEIGIAPVRPAEFVVIRISQLAGGGQIAE
jgi:phage tail sheath protein FI